MNKKLKEFKRMTKDRGIEFAYIGMSVEVAGQKGVIVGSNRSFNLDVYFKEGNRIDNCHPYWEIVYYQNDKIVMDFREKRGS